MKIGLRVNKGNTEFVRVQDATLELGIGGADSFCTCNPRT